MTAEPAALVPVAAERVAARGAEIRAAADRCEIADQASLEKAAAFLGIVKAFRREIDETFDASIAAAFQAHKTIVAAKKQHSVPVEDAERIVKRKMGAYSSEQDRLRREEEARRRAEAEEARRTQEAERAADAAWLAAQGPEAAPVAVAPPAPAPVALAPPAPLPPPAAAPGVSFRERWVARVDDVAALIAAVAAGRAPQALLLPDQSMLNKHAAAYHDKAPIPGVAFTSERVVVAR